MCKISGDLLSLPSRLDIVCCGVHHCGAESFLYDSVIRIWSRTLTSLILFGKLKVILSILQILHCSLPGWNGLRVNEEVCPRVTVRARIIGRCLPPFTCYCGNFGGTFFISFCHRNFTLIISWLAWRIPDVLLNFNSMFLFKMRSVLEIFVYGEEPLLFDIVLVCEESVDPTGGVDFNHMFPVLGLFSWCDNHWSTFLLTIKRIDTLFFFNANLNDFGQRDDFWRFLVCWVLIVNNCSLFEIVDEEALDKLGQIEQFVLLSFKKVGF